MDLSRLDSVQLTFDASHPVRGAFATAVLANLERLDFELIRLPKIPTNIVQMIADRGLVFVGFVGVVNGEAKSAFQVPLDDDAIAVLTAAYLMVVEDALAARLATAVLRRTRAKPPNEYDA